jgi:hypothetical protein
LAIAVATKERHMTDERNVADELIAAMGEALAIARGEAQPAAVHRIELPRNGNEDALADL